MENTHKELGLKTLNHKHIFMAASAAVLSLLLLSGASPAQAEYRTIDGQYNNPYYPERGSTNQPLLKPAGVDNRREPGGRIFNQLKSARDISNIVSDQDGLIANSRGLSDLFWIWGQFLDHDITLVHVDENQRVDIEVADNDPNFDANIRFTRSERTNGNQLNALTAFIDASNVYGSDEETATKVRRFRNGRLKTSSGNLLPLNDDGSFLAGDERSNEHGGLTAMHTLWMREHNRLANRFRRSNPGWSDERLYQEARRWVIAEMQAITYNEFLPRLLGQNALFPYLGYEVSYEPDIVNSFATAAYRFGHSMLPPNLLLMNKAGAVTEQLPLRQAFFNPQKIKDNNIAPFLRGAASQTAQELDPLIIDDVRNFLFRNVADGNRGEGFDLAALNIQRGRDHALPGYNRVRRSLGLPTRKNFNNNHFRSGFAAKLREAYGNRPGRADLWVAGIAEKPFQGALVGETFYRILVYQFEALREADRFWYENQYSPTPFSQREINQLNRLRLADVIRRNTGISNEIQNNVMDASNRHQDSIQSEDVFIQQRSIQQPEVLSPEQIERLEQAVQSGELG